MNYLQVMPGLCKIFRRDVGAHDDLAPDGLDDAGGLQRAELLAHRLDAAPGGLGDLFVTDLDCLSNISTFPTVCRLERDWSR